MHGLIPARFGIERSPVFKRLDDHRLCASMLRICQGVGVTTGAVRPFAGSAPNRPMLSSCDCILCGAEIERREFMLYGG
jgi:hypothetical protein